jgi:HPr kinase/phosphorylase
MPEQQQPGWLNHKPLRKEAISARYFFEHMKDRFKLRIMAGEAGLDRRMVDKNLHRPGLALAGYVDLFTHHRLQVFGNTEVYYLRSLAADERRQAVEKIAKFEIPCIVVTSGNEFAPEILEVFNAHDIPVLYTPIETTQAIYLITDFLDDQFNLHTSLHGSFVDVYGVGILFVGKSGVGKSEVVLDLIERGHRLVTDDVTVVTKKGEGILMGSGTEMGGHFMEIRGLCILNVREMFGIRAIRFQKRVEVIVELEVWDKDAVYTRTGLDESTVKILDVEVLRVKLPILPGKNITVISEVIALNYLLKHYGYDASQELAKKIEKRIAMQATHKENGTNERGIPYFEHDFE